MILSAERERAHKSEHKQYEFHDRFVFSFQECHGQRPGFMTTMSLVGAQNYHPCRQVGMVR